MNVATRELENEAMAESENTLVIERKFAATPERVFAAFTDAAVIKNWFGPESMEVPEADMDVRVGGSYRIRMQSISGDEDHTVAGVYREIDPPNRLSFTWAWQGDEMPGVETLVTLDFAAAGTGTLMTLTQEGFENTTFRDHHNEGWSSSFNCLDAVL
jgi:uncharacterized protein YndB with AHSA1/START domain